MPVTAARTAALPVVRVWSYPARRRRRRLATRARRPLRGRAGGGNVQAGTVYAAYAPAGSFTLTQHGHTVATAGLRWASQYRVVAGRGRRSRSRCSPTSLARPPGAGRVGSAGGRLVGRPAGRVAARPRPGLADERERDGDVCARRTTSASGAGGSFASSLAVIVGVAVAAGAKGAPTAPGCRRRPTALVNAPNAESSAWYCTGQSTCDGGGARLPRPHQHAAAAGQRHCDHGHRRWSHGHPAVPVPALGVTAPSLPSALDGVVAGPDRHRRRGRRRRLPGVHGSSGWGESPCQSTTSSQWYFPGGATAAPSGSTCRCSTRRPRPSSST